MSYAFRVVLFEGICGFVPNRPIDDPNPPDRLRVVIPEAEYDVGDLCLTPHYAALIIPMSCVASIEGRAPDFLIRSKWGGEISYVYALRYVDVKFHLPANSATPLNFVPGKPSGQRPVSGEEHYFAWVSDMQMACSDLSRVKDDCFLPLDPDPSVFARVEVMSGTMGTHSFSRVQGVGGNYVIPIWDFRVPGDPNPTPFYTQALANVVALNNTIKSDEDKILVEVSTFLSQGGPGRLLLELSPGVTSDVEIKICNLEWAGIMAAPMSRKPEDFMRDFLLLYRLSSNWPLINSEPPLPTMIDPVAIGRSIHCPDGLFASHPKRLRRGLVL